MNGPDHYRAAERLLERCGRRTYRIHVGGPLGEVEASETSEQAEAEIRTNLVAAQVHATLALTAVLAEHAPDFDLDRTEDWTSAVTR